MTFMTIYSIIGGAFFIVTGLWITLSRKKDVSQAGDLERGTPWSMLLGVCLFKFSLVILLLTVGFTTIWADDPTRWIISYKWSQHPFFSQPDQVWLPLCFYLYGLSMKIIPDLLLATRTMSLIISLASLFGMYVFGSTLTGRRYIGVLSALILATIPMHTWISVMTMSDVLYLVFEGLAPGFFLLYVWNINRDNLKRAKLALLGMLFSVICLTATRYEGWMLGSVIGLVFWLHWFISRVYCKKVGWGWFVVVSVGMALFPMLWMGRSWKVLGSPLGFLSTYDHDAVAGSYMSNAIGDKLMRYPKSLYLYFGKLVPLGLAGMIWSLFQRKKSPVLFIGVWVVILYLGLLEISVLIGGTAVALRRCTMAISFLFIPFSLLPLWYYGERKDIFPGWLRAGALVLIVPIFLLVIGGNIRETFQWRRYGWSGEGTALAKYLQTEMRFGDDLDIWEKHKKIIISTPETNSPSHRLLRKMCAEPERLFIMRSGKIPPHWLKDKSLLIIIHKDELEDPRWEKFKTFGDYTFYRHK